MVQLQRRPDGQGHLHRRGGTGNRFLRGEGDFARQRRGVAPWRGRPKAGGLGKPDLCLGSNQSIIEIKYRQGLPQWKNQTNWLFDPIL